MFNKTKNQNNNNQIRTQKSQLLTKIVQTNKKDKTKTSRKTRKMNTQAFVAELPYVGQVDVEDLVLLFLCASVVLLLLAVLCRFANFVTKSWSLWICSLFVVCLIVGLLLLSIFASVVLLFAVLRVFVEQGKLITINLSLCLFGCFSSMKITVLPCTRWYASDLFV